jgi:hypothetical protein
VTDQRGGQAVAGTPHDVKTRVGIARREQPALDPVGHREVADALAAQPPVHLVRAVAHIGLRPALGPQIGFAKFGKRIPVGQCLVNAVAKTGTALLWRVHRKHATKTLLGQATQAVGLITVQQAHAFALGQQLERADDAGQATAYDEHLGLHSVHCGLHAFLIRKR